MAQIKKITDKQGNDIYLRTHTKAVVDDNGYTAESRLQAMQDEINAAQLGIGAVESDLTPIEGSVNYVTSGGLYNQLYIGDSDEEIDLSQYTEVAGWINTSNKWNTSYYGIFIPIEVYNSYRITANDIGSTRYALLTSNTVGTNNTSVSTFATNCTGVALVSGESAVIDIYAINAKYLWIGTTVSVQDDRKPQKVEIVSRSGTKSLKQAVLDNEGKIGELQSYIDGAIEVTETAMMTFKNASSFAFAYSTKIWVATSTGTYSVHFHMNDGITIASGTTSGTRIFGIRVARKVDDSYTTVAGYDYTYLTQGTEVEYTVTSIFDEAQTDYDLDFDLQTNDIVFVIDRLSGSASYYIYQTTDNLTISKNADDIASINSMIGDLPTYPQTFVPVTTFAMSQSVKILQIARSGTYTMKLVMDSGWTTTALWNGTTQKENIFSWRITESDYASGGSVIEYRNYAKNAFTTSAGVYIYKFEDELTWQREMTAGQCVYIISRLDGTGTITVNLDETLVDRVGYLETNASMGIVDEDTSIDDVATNKLDGEIAMLSKTLAVNTRTNMIMCFFSDIHGDARNIQRVLDFCNHYNISCIIHGGDSVADYNGNGTPFTSETGALVMNIIGNHDTTSTTSNAYRNDIALTTLYQTFMAPFEDLVTFPEGAEENGYCYWHRDYSSEGIRIIGLNCMTWTSAQSTWLSVLLDDAITNSLAVIIVSHYPADGIDGFDTGFNSRQWNPDYKNRTLYLFNTGVVGLVDDFIDNDGEFICYLTGHQHRDHIGTCKHATNPQVQLTIDSTSTERHANGIYATSLGKNSIDFDIIGIDRYQKCIKVIRVGRNKDMWMREFKTMCIDYENGTLYNRYNLI